MKTSGDTAGHELAKGDEKDRNRRNALEALEIAKTQQAAKKGSYVFDTKRKAYFFKQYNE